MSTVKDLETEERRLLSELTDVRIRLREARLTAFPRRVGDIVEDGGEVHKITGIHVDQNGWFRVCGVRRKKNGEWSKREYSLHGLGGSFV